MQVPLCKTCKLFRPFDEKQCALGFTPEPHTLATQSLKYLYSIAVMVQDVVTISRDCTLNRITLKDGTMFKPEYIEIETGGE